MNKDRNYTLAAQYFEESHRHGNPDAASHLGILHLHGYYPNKTADPVNQLLFYAIFFSQFTLIDFFCPFLRCIGNISAMQRRFINIDF